MPESGLPGSSSIECRSVPGMCLHQRLSSAISSDTGMPASSTQGCSIRLQLAQSRAACVTPERGPWDRIRRSVAFLRSEESSEKWWPRRDWTERRCLPPPGPTEPAAVDWLMAKWHRRHRARPQFGCWGWMGMGPVGHTTSPAAEKSTALCGKAIQEGAVLCSLNGGVAAIIP